MQRPFSHIINKFITIQRWNMVKSILSTAILILAFTAATAWAERLAVRGTIANIRAGAGTNHQVIWKVEKYHPLEIIKKKGEWYQFKDFEGDRGWIHKSLLQKIPTVITKKDNCNVRSGPSTKNEIVFTVEKGIPFKILKKQDVWVQIQHADGDQGWIHSSLVW
jgi:SH3-like domain-containing protein